MIRPCIHVSIGDIRFDFVTELEIISTWEELTSTCTITIPKKATVDGKPLVEGAASIFNVGDPVRIRAGYDLSYDVIYEGYVTYVKTGFPIQIICEDAMWLFKRQTYAKAFKDVTLKGLVDYLLSKITTKITVVNSFPDLKLGKFRIGKGATGADVFEELRKTYGISCYFRDNILYVGLVYSHSSSANYARKVDFFYKGNIIDDDLLYRQKDQREFKIVGNVLIPGKDKKNFFKVEAGSSSGQAIQQYYFNLTHAQAQKMVDAALQRYKVPGFEGGFMTFGRPFVRHGDTAVIHDSDIPERNGSYLVRKVTRRFSVSDGYKQEVELDIRSSF